jgi:hypothetical protein
MHKVYVLPICHFSLRMLTKAKSFESKGWMHN